MTFDETAVRRDGDGRFAEKPAAPEAGVELGESAGTAPVPLDRLGLQVGDTLSVPESEHGDEDLGEVTIGRDEQGYYATGGPDVYLYAAVPDDVIDVDANPSTDFEDNYLDERHHRLADFVDSHYVGQLDLRGFETHDGARVAFTTRLDESSDTSTVLSQLHERTGVDTLVADCSEDSEVDGQTQFSRDLAEHLRVTDEAARTPREVKVPAGACFTQAQLDDAVKNAREHIPITRSVTRPEYRTGFTVVEQEDLVSRSPRLAVFKDDAWTRPKRAPLLPWSPPVGTPVAHVDRDGHADLVEDGRSGQAAGSRW